MVRCESETKEVVVHGESETKGVEVATVCEAGISRGEVETNSDEVNESPNDEFEGMCSPDDEKGVLGVFGMLRGSGRGRQ